MAPSLNVLSTSESKHPDTDSEASSRDYVKVYA